MVDEEAILRRALDSGAVTEDEVRSSLEDARLGRRWGSRLAALVLRGGIDTILIPKENEKDLIEIPNNVKRNLTIVRVDHMDEVLAASLALSDPEAFLHEGDHEIEDIHEVAGHDHPVEVPAAPGVN